MESWVIVDEMLKHLAALLFDFDRWHAEPSSYWRLLQTDASRLLQPI